MIARVYGAINAVAADLSKEGVAKERLNTRDNYLFRSIDDVLKRLSPLLAEHRLCVLPRVLERTAIDRLSDSGELLVSVTLRAAFDLVSVEDGSTHTIEAFGEALDAGDKGTAKAMQSAYKYAMLQAFCVPAAQAEDADARSHRLKPPQLPAEPEEGWPQWAQGFEEVVRTCSSAQDLQQLQDDSRSLLTSLSRENPELYRAVGQAMAARRAELKSDGQTRSPARQKDTARRKGTAPSAERPKRARAAKPNGSAAHA